MVSGGVGLTDRPKMPHPNEAALHGKEIFCNPMENVWHIPKIPEWLMTDVVCDKVGLTKVLKCLTQLG